MTNLLVPERVSISVEIVERKYTATPGVSNIAVNCRDMPTNAVDRVGPRTGFARLGGLIAAAVLIAFSFAEAARAVEPIAALDAWSAAKLMGVGVNIGNTLENTSSWETGWGNPR